LAPVMASLVAVFAYNIRRLRRARGLTQVQLAEFLGMTGTYVSMLERGARGVAFETIGACADIFRVAPEHLLRAKKLPQHRLAGTRERERRRVR
jgi:transcriptional regulator with XRE-family HTH domain